MKGLVLLVNDKTFLLVYACSFTLLGLILGNQLPSHFLCYP